MRDSWRKRFASSVWAVTFAVAAAVVTISATGDEQPDLDLQQPGHWVYGADGKALYHVDGGTKAVDARTGQVALGPDHTIVQGDGRVMATDGGDVTIFGKSTLAVEGEFPVDLAEVPVGLEVVGGPYLVYRQAGSVVRFGTVPPTVIQVGGPLSEPAVTEDGTVWVQRLDSTALCMVEPLSDKAVCPVTSPGERRGAVAAVGKDAVFVDAAAGTATPVRADGLGATVRIGVQVRADARVATLAVAGRLAMVDPAESLLLMADLRDIRSSGPRNHAVSVDLGPGDFAAPVPTTESVVVLDHANERLLTFDVTGKRKSSVPLPDETGMAKVARGEDGRVYVDARTGKHTLVVDWDGSVQKVGIGEQDLPNPTTRRPPPSPPPAPPPPARPEPPTRPDKRAAIPGAPTSLDARPGNASAALAWGPAADNGARVTEYQVTWRATDGDGAGGARSLGGNQLSATVDGLSNGTTYVFSVRARNSVGVGPAVDSPPVRPSSETPGSPGAVAAVTEPTGSVQVSWEPANGEGRQITGYTVTARAADGTTVSAGQVQGTRAVVGEDTLALGTTYTFIVTAANDLGLTGVPSPASNAVTPYRPAASPAATASAGDRRVDLTWTQPELNGGELVGYLVTADGVPETAVTSPAASFTDLANGTRYSFQVVAQTRERGSSGPPVSGEPVQVVSTPGRTATVDVVSARLSGDRHVTLTVAVNEHGSGAVTCHILFNGGERWTGRCGGTMDINVGGLDYSTSYTVSATGSNSFGTGPAGGSAGVRTNDPPPPPPSVSVSKGPRVNRADCNTSGCAMVHVTLRHFAPNTGYSTQCRNNSGVFWTYTIRTDGAGNADNETCYYGLTGTPVWVVSGGHESNRITW